MDSDGDDPLVLARPPATDYITYLTLLEYNLSPQRLPTLHALLQDEALTSNIGWDLVQLLLPMLPESRDCLHDIARVGNPREVILRVDDALMQLQPEQPEPRDIDQFACLLAMLSVLHARIKTRHPSRFIATSLQAALESYSVMPSAQTTLAMLEFLRDVSPSKRPPPPPRSGSESTVRVSASSAADPEAETQSTDDTVLVQKFLQFGLLELLKSYLLSLPEGMSWAVRVQETLHPEIKLPGRSQVDQYTTDQHLKERDMIIAKITVRILMQVRSHANDRHYLATLVWTTQTFNPLYHNLRIASHLRWTSRSYRRSRKMFLSKDTAHYCS